MTSKADEIYALISRKFYYALHDKEVASVLRAFDTWLPRDMLKHSRLLATKGA